LTSRFKVERRDALLLAAFQAVVGILQLATLALLDVRMVWIGVLAVLSLIAAYGLFTVKKWSVWLVIGLFFPQLVFGVSTLYGTLSLYYFSLEMVPLLFEISLIVFVILSAISFLYVAAKRNTF
jgi:uncharacterized membrane protein (DUF2068 family)